MKLSLSLSLLLIPTSLALTARICGGHHSIPCKESEICVPKDPKCNNTTCIGTCQPFGPSTDQRVCGGFRSPDEQFGCAEGEVCIDDPRSDSCGMACDELGICVDPQALFCGGIAGIPCPTGKKCYDFPGDGCDPQNGGFDCGGICL